MVQPGQTAGHWSTRNGSPAFFSPPAVIGDTTININKTSTREETHSTLAPSHKRTCVLTCDSDSSTARLHPSTTSRLRPSSSRRRRRLRAIPLTTALPDLDPAARAHLQGLGPSGFNHSIQEVHASCAVRPPVTSACCAIDRRSLFSLAGGPGFLPEVCLSLLFVDRPTPASPTDVSHLPPSAHSSSALAAWLDSGCS